MSERCKNCGEEKVAHKPALRGAELWCKDSGWEQYEPAEPSEQQTVHEGEVLPERSNDEAIVKEAIPSAYCQRFADRDGDWFRIGGEKNRLCMWFGSKGSTTREQAWARARVAPTVVAYEASLPHPCITPTPAAESDEYCAKPCCGHPKSLHDGIEGECTAPSDHEGKDYEGEVGFQPNVCICSGFMDRHPLGSGASPSRSRGDVAARRRP